mmetsp:Transcript_36985/g.104396  ORF Transcript_36985/g.104396 Transcript_36985/m.104396 type:complete len:106 (+) Transcript_36985:94-411(+)
MPDTVVLPGRKPPAETRNLKKTDPNSCQKRKVAKKKGYTDPKSSKAIQQRAARAPRNPFEHFTMAMSSKLPSSLRNGAGQFFGGIGNFMQRFFGSNDGIRSGRRI